MVQLRILFSARLFACGRGDLARIWKTDDSDVCDAFVLVRASCILFNGDGLFVSRYPICLLGLSSHMGQLFDCLLFLFETKDFRLDVKVKHFIF